MQGVRSLIFLLKLLYRDTPPGRSRGQRNPSSSSRRRGQRDSQTNNTTFGDGPSQPYSNRNLNAAKKAREDLARSKEENVLKQREEQKRRQAESDLDEAESLKARREERFPRSTSAGAARRSMSCSRRSTRRSRSSVSRAHQQQQKERRTGQDWSDSASNVSSIAGSASSSSSAGSHPEGDLDTFLAIVMIVWAIVFYFVHVYYLKLMSLFQGSS